MTGSPPGPIVLLQVVGKSPIWVKLLPSIRHIGFKRNSVLNCKANSNSMVLPPPTAGDRRPQDKARWWMCSCLWVSLPGGLNVDPCSLHFPSSWPLSCSCVPTAKSTHLQIASPLGQVDHTAVLGPELDSQRAQPPVKLDSCFLFLLKIKPAL